MGHDIPPAEDSLSPSLALRLETVCARFETAWKHGQRPWLEEYLADAPKAGRSVLFGELLALELECRRSRGEQPTLEEYQRRFPADLVLIQECFSETAPPARRLLAWRLSNQPTKLGRDLPCTSMLSDPRPNAAPTSESATPVSPPEGGSMHEPGNPFPVVPGYEIEGVLGRGGMGVVYQARHLALNRVVALKMILAGSHATPQDLARFRREAQAVASLRHPNIVQIYEVGAGDGLPFFSLEFMDGGSLAQKLAGTPMPARQAGVLVESLARAVQHAHAHGIIHRDLKPANILLTRDGTAKVADFGLAKWLQEDMSQTQTGTVIGTPSYMAPEQAEAQHGTVGPATDVYALGAALYEMLTGRPPFRAETKRETAWQVLHQDPVPPTQLQPRVSRDLETICLKCLEKEPGRRYGTAEALAEDLRRFLAGEPILARPATLLERAAKWARRRPGVAASLALSALVTAAAFALVTWQWQEAERARQQAEQAERAESAQRQRAEVARQKEEEQRRQFQRLSATLLLEKGQGLCHQEDVGRGLLWLVRSLQVAPSDDADIRRVIRRNLGDWQRQLYPLRTAFSHSRWINAAALSPDGRRVLTGSSDSTARLWDADTGQPLGPPLRHKGTVKAVAFSPDGKTLLTGSSDKTARLWDAATGKPLGVALQHEGKVVAAAFSPDGQTVVTASTNRTARLWDAATGQPRGDPLGHEGELVAIAFSPDGKKVLTGSGDKTARLWDATTGQPLGAPLQHDKPVKAVAFNHNGKVCATGGEDGTARLWNTVTGTALGHPLKHGGTVLALAFSPDSALLLTGSTDQQAHLWSVSTGTKFAQLKHGGSVSCVAFSPDGETMLTGSYDQTVRLWGRSPRRPLGLPLAHQSEVRKAVFTADGKRVLTSTRERTVRLWDVAGGSASALDLLGHQAESRAVAFSRDGKRVLTGSIDHTARLWDAATGKGVAEPLQHQDKVEAVAFSADGKRVLTGSHDHTARLWDAVTGKPLGEPLQHQGPVVVVAFSPDGQTAMTASTDGTARLWEAATGKSLGGALRHRSLSIAVFSPDGQRIVTGGADGTARFWDAATGRSLKRTLKHQSAVFAVAFSPDGKTVATGSSDETAQFWDAATGAPVGEALKHQGPVRVVAFSPDGKLLLTGSDDRTARLWRVPTGQPACPPLTHQRGVKAIAFSPDGKTILTGSSDGSAIFWDVATGRSLGRPLRHPYRGIVAVAFSPDGKRVITAGEQKVTRLWPVPVPVAGEVERLRLWVEVCTGLELDADGAVGALDAARWQERQIRLKDLGGPPSRE